MPSNPNQTIYILFLVAVGFMVGAVLATWLAGREKAKKSQKQPVVRSESKPAYGLNPEQYEEVVSLWRVRADGRLVVLQGGKPVDAANQLPDAKRKQMELSAREWLIWMGLLPSQAKAQSNPAAQVPKQEAVQPPVNKSVAPTAIPIAQPNPASAAPSTTVTTVVEPKKAGSIVQQINDILQENLRTSGLINRGIRLVEDTRQGVIVYVGLQRFIGIDAVTDPEIKATIKSAVSEWERRTENGK